MRMNKKVAVVASITAVVALGSTAAVAYWTAVGDGAGTASIGTSTDFVITGDIANALVLDVAQPFTIKVANSAVSSQRLTTLTYDFTPSDANCLKAWFTTVQPTVAVGGVDVPGTSGAGFTNFTGASLKLNNMGSAIDQEVCKSISIDLDYTSS